MTDIASNLDKVIEKLDGMTSEVVNKNYGMDIASKVGHIAKQLDYVQAGGGSGDGDTGITLQINSFQPDPSTPATYTTVPSFDELSQAQVMEKGFSNVVINGGKPPIFSVRCEYNWNANEPTIETIYVSCGEFSVGSDAYGHMIAGITTELYTISHNGVTYKNGPSIQSNV